MKTLVSATYDKATLTVDYLASDGSHLLRSGGTIAWRFNNPGNIRPAKTNEAARIGVGDTASGQFAIFPSYEVGRNEKRALLRRKYNDYTIGQAIEIYAPRNENDTDSYIQYVLKRSGLSDSKKLSEFSDQELNSMMKAMEEKEGFNGKFETRKEQWVNVTNISISNGARPIQNEQVQLKSKGKILTLETNKYGEISSVLHTKEKSEIDVFLKNMEGVWKKVHSFIADGVTQTFVLFKDIELFKASTLPVKPISDSSAKPKPFVYIVQSGDTVSKIAKKFKTSVDEIKKANPSIKNIEKIYPEQKIAIYGNIETSSASKIKPNETDKSKKSKKSNAVSVEVQRSKEGKGEALALINPDQKRAPWMEVAVREAIQWNGKREEQITKEDNYHELVGVGLNSIIGTSNAWCASFVNYCLQTAGYAKSKRTASALSFRSDSNFIEIKKPIYGAIATISTGKGFGHACFVYGKTNDENFVRLGGNQDDQITLDARPINSYRYYIPLSYKLFADSEDLVDVVNLDDLKKIGLPVINTKSTR